MDVEGPELLSLTLEILDLLQSLRIVLEDELVKAQNRHRNSIAAKCTAVGFGTAGTIVSTVGVGIALAPVTAGISIPILTGIGIAVSTLSASGSIWAEIRNSVSTKTEIGKVAKLEKRARRLQSTWDCLFSCYPFRDKLLSELNITRPEAIRDDVRETRVPKGESILKWLSIRKMYTDYRVNPEDLRPGDHIKVPGGHSASVKRFLRRSAYYHHGVYMGIINGIHKVADFGRENRTIPVMTTLDDFCGSSNILFKRDYKGNDISVEETKNLARQCSEGNNWEEYNLLVNNCEHYATLLKLKQRWSGQAFLVEFLRGQGSPTPQAIKHVSELIKETCQGYESVVDKLIEMPY